MAFNELSDERRATAVVMLNVAPSKISIHAALRGMRNSAPFWRQNNNFFRKKKQQKRICILPDTIDHVGSLVFQGCHRLLTNAVNYEFDCEDEDEDEEDYYDEPINNNEVNEWMMERYANLPFHQACSSISITPQVIVHGIIERATEVDEYRMTALHILCADRSFSSVMAFWYGCMPPLTESGKKRKRGS